jgi:hypothetical protein
VKRAMATRVIAMHGLSQRRACGLIEITRRSFRRVMAEPKLLISMATHRPVRSSTLDSELQGRREGSSLISTGSPKPLELTRSRRRCWGESKKEDPDAKETHPQYGEEYR